MKTYRVNEIFHSLQGEGARAGEASVFVRLAGCNLACRRDTHGFDCDTEFTSGVPMPAAAIASEARRIAPSCEWIVLTGGEPTLQVDAELVAALRAAEFRLAIETNGTNPVPDGIEWITVSPKSAEHTLAQLEATEVKYVRALGQAVPRTRVNASHYFISPAFAASGALDRETLAHCIRLCLENPKWKLSTQQHKLWNVR
jgi:7-carboxy-7-deazaguanine synthase